MEVTLFAFFAALALISSIVVVMHRNPMHSLLGFLVTVAATAVLFLMLAAPWAAVLQVTLYGLAWLVLLPIFRTLLRTDERPPNDHRRSFTRFSAGLLATAFASLSAALLGRGSQRSIPLDLPAKREAVTSSIQVVLENHQLLIGLLGLLLLVTAVGAHAVGRQHDGQEG